MGLRIDIVVIDDSHHKEMALPFDQAIRGNWAVGFEEATRGFSQNANSAHQIVSLGERPGPTLSHFRVLRESPYIAGEPIGRGLPAVVEPQPDSLELLRFPRDIFREFNEEIGAQFLAGGIPSDVNLLPGSVRLRFTVDDRESSSEQRQRENDRSIYFYAIRLPGFLAIAIGVWLSSLVAPYREPWAPFYALGICLVVLGFSWAVWVHDLILLWEATIVTR